MPDERAVEGAREGSPASPLVAASIALRNAVSGALRAGEYEIGEVLLDELRDLANLPWAPALVRTELARALGVVHIVAWREEDASRARIALRELHTLVSSGDASPIERELLARAYSREHGLADRSGDEVRAAEALDLLRENARHPGAGEWDVNLLARALFRAQRAALVRGQRAHANALLAELRTLARDANAGEEDRLCFARALIDAIWHARNPGSARSRALRLECLRELDGLAEFPPSHALRSRLP